MTKKGVLIGCNYPGTSNALYGCINDVRQFRKVLVGEYKFLESSIKMLIDESDYPLKPTRANIFDAIDWLLRDAKSGDTLVFQYSGHGSQVPDRNHDEKDGLDECIVPTDFTRSGMIIDDDLRARLANKVPSGVKLFALIDACHSGTSFDLRFNFYNSQAKIVSEEDKGYKPTAADVVVLSACKDAQVAADTFYNGISGGALTFAFLETVRGKRYRIRFDELLTMARRFIIDKRLSDQIPQISMGSNGNLNRPFTL